MDEMVPGLRQTIVRRVLAMLGAAGALGVATQADAMALPERTALEARVADMRRQLTRANAADSAPPALIAQAGKWNNWPNWSNWANWRNG